MITADNFVYLTPYFASFFIALGIGFYTWHHRSVIGAIPYFIYILCQVSIVIFSIFELGASSLQAKIFWDNMQWFGFLYGPIAFFVFVLEFTGRQRPNSRRVWILTSIPTILFFLLVATNQWHGLTLQDPQLIDGDIFVLLTYEYTPIVLLASSYAYILGIASIGFLFYQLLHTHRVYRAQLITIIIGFSIPFLTTLLAAFNTVIYIQRDITPLATALGNLFVAWGLFRYRLFDLKVIGRDIIIENMTDIVLVIDQQNRVMDINPILATRMGQQKTEIVGQTTDTAFAQWPHLVTQLNNLNNVRTEVTLKGEQTEVTFELIFSSVFDQRDKQVGRVIIARDITERKIAEKTQKVLLNMAQSVTVSTNLEELLAYIHQQLSTLINTTNFYVALYDPDNDHYLFPIWMDEYDTDANAWRPQPLPHSYTDYVRRTGEPLFADWELHHQLVAQGEIELIDSPSDLWLGTPLRTPEGVIGVLVVQSYDNPDLYTVEDLKLLAFASDTIALVIERKAKEDALEAYRDHLEELVDKRTIQLGQKNRELRREIKERQLAQNDLRAYAKELERSNRELEDFAYISSHDLQEPLRKIQTFSDRLQYRYKDQLDEKGQDYLTRMQSAARRSQKLITDLLIYSRISSKGAPFAKVDLSRTVETVLHDFEIKIKESKVEVQLATLPTIQADATQMYQLWQSLIGNALKFQREDVHLLMEIMEVWDDSVSEGYCRLMIRDNGIGFEEKYLDRIFTVFQRLHTQEELEGTGIGLAICRRIVERHNGRIWASSSPNQGTKFYIDLPITQPQNRR